MVLASAYVSLGGGALVADSHGLQRRVSFSLALLSLSLSLAQVLLLRESEVFTPYFGRSTTHSPTLLLALLKASHSVP